MRLAAVLALPLLLLGSVAASSPASFVAASVTLPEGATLLATGPTLFVPELAPEGSIEIRAARVHVERFTFDGVGIGARFAGLNRSASFELTDARVVLVRPAGYLGVYPDPEVGFVARAEGPARIEPHADAVLGNGRLAAPGADASSPPFRGPLEPGAPVAALAGDVDLSGDVSMKIYGSRVRFYAAENESVTQTGARPTGPGGAARTEEWLLLHFDDADVRMRGPGTVLAGAPEMRFAAAPRVVLHPVAKDAVQLEGAVDAVVLRAASASGLPVLVGPSAADVALRPAASVSTPAPAWGAAYAAATIASVGGIAGVLLAQRRAERHAFTAAECARLAREAAQRGRLRTALDWTRRAQRLAPEAASLRLDEARLLLGLGDPYGAFAACHAASRLGEDGEPDLLAARILVDIEGPMETIVERLVAALARSPSLARAIESDPRFVAALADARLVRTLDAAA